MGVLARYYIMAILWRLTAVTNKIPTPDTAHALDVVCLWIYFIKHFKCRTKVRYKMSKLPYSVSDVNHRTTTVEKMHARGLSMIVGNDYVSTILYRLRGWYRTLLSLSSSSSAADGPTLIITLLARHDRVFSFACSHPCRPSPPLLHDGRIHRHPRAEDVVVLAEHPPNGRHQNDM